MTADERLDLIRLKIERAKQHLRDLEVARNRFMQAEPYRVVRERHPYTRHHIYRVFDLKTPSGEIGLIAGDVVHNLRSALDHLAYALVSVNGNTPTKRTAFPIWDDEAKYVANSGGQVKWMSQTARNAIDGTEPYQGGQGEALWVLHYLDIADKHHSLLTPLVNVTDVRLTLPGYWQRNYMGVGAITVLNFGAPLIEGSIVGTRDPEMNDDMHLTLDLAFTEPEVIRGKPLVPLLVSMSDYIDRLVLGFKSLLG